VGFSTLFRPAMRGQAAVENRLPHVGRCYRCGQTGSRYGSPHVVETEAFGGSCIGYRGGGGDRVERWRTGGDRKVSEQHHDLFHRRFMELPRESLAHPAYIAPAGADSSRPLHGFNRSTGIRPVVIASLCRDVSSWVWTQMASAAAHASSTTGLGCADTRTPRRS
jgi:hypothetical protein